MWRVRLEGLPQSTHFTVVLQIEPYWIERDATDLADPYKPAQHEREGSVKNLFLLYYLVQTAIA